MLELLSVWVWIFLISKDICGPDFALSPSVASQSGHPESKSAIWNIIWNLGDPTCIFLLIQPQGLLNPCFSTWRAGGMSIPYLVTYLKMYVCVGQGDTSACSCSLLSVDACLSTELETPFIHTWNSVEIILNGTLLIWTALISKTRLLLYDWTVWFLCSY